MPNSENLHVAGERVRQKQKSKLLVDGGVEEQMDID
jgi:hypothetical protein